jgi:hypothetical protein
MIKLIAWVLSSGINRPECERDLKTVPRLLMHGDMTPLHDTSSWHAASGSIRSFLFYCRNCRNKRVQSLGPPTKTTCSGVITSILLTSRVCHAALDVMTIWERESRASLIIFSIKSLVTKQSSVLFPTWRASLHGSCSTVTVRAFSVFHAVSGCYLQLISHLLSTRPFTPRKIRGNHFC